MKHDMKHDMKQVALAICVAALAVVSVAVQAGGFTENNVKISFLKETGSGADGKSAAIKLENSEAMSVRCFEDIIIFDASTADGKKTYTGLLAVFKSKKPLKSISFIKDDEGDCKLDKFEK